MAVGDGQPPSIPPEAVDAHLASCAECRAEIVEMEKLNSLLGSQRRQIPSDDLWPHIGQRLDARKGIARERRPVPYPFFLLGALLAAYRLIELVPDRRIEIVFKLVPVIIAISLFAFLKENPFKVNIHLGTESE